MPVLYYVCVVGSQYRGMTKLSMAVCGEELIIMRAVACYPDTIRCVMHVHMLPKCMLYEVRTRCGGDLEPTSSKRGGQI